MADESQNHYQVLKIERNADERAIKKAYFSLVREFPPATHPEEFKRIREAYEVLSDPVARQRFDAADKSFDEYGAEVAAELRDIEETIKAGDDEGAQEKLRDLIRERPELSIARENLASSYLRTGAFGQALDQFQALADEHPDEARYDFHRGLALSRLERHDEALAALRQAHEKKADDLRIHLALIDVLMNRRELDESLEQIDDAAARHDKEKKGDPWLPIALRRVDALASMSGLPKTHDALDTFIARVRAADDPELPKYASSQLAAIAAKLFARDEPDRANALLERCSELTPDSLVDRPFPHTARIDVADLSAEAHEWLSTARPEQNTPTVPRAVWPAPVAAFLAASAIGASSSFLLFDEPESSGVAAAVYVVVLLAGIACALAWSVRRAAAIVTSPIRGFSTVHPLYFLQSNADTIDVYPLFRASNVSGTHHHTNGGYTHTLLTLTFGPKVVTVRFSNKDYAQGWLDYFSGARRRALELMMEGYLEAEHGVDLIPPALLTRPRSSEARRKASYVRWYGGAAALAVAVSLVVVPLRARRADDHAYRLALRAGTHEAYRAYLTARPTGRHVEPIKKLADGSYERAAEALRSGIDPGANGHKALTAALDALRAAGSTTIFATVTSKAEIPALTSALGEPDPAFSASLTVKRETTLIARLTRTLDGAGLGGAMVLKQVTRPADATGPVVLVIRKHTRPEKARLTALGLPELPSLEVVWDAEITVNGASIYRFATTVAAPAEVPVRRPSDLARPLFASVVFERIEDAAFATFVTRFAADLGLSAAPPLRRDVQARGASPYE